MKGLSACLPAPPIIIDLDFGFDFFFYLGGAFCALRFPFVFASFLFFPVYVTLICNGARPSV